MPPRRTRSEGAGSASSPRRRLSSGSRRSAPRSRCVDVGADEKKAEDAGWKPQPALELRETERKEWTVCREDLLERLQDRSLPGGSLPSTCAGTGTLRGLPREQSAPVELEDFLASRLEHLRQGGFLDSRGALGQRLLEERVLLRLHKGFRRHLPHGVALLRSRNRRPG